MKLSDLENYPCNSKEADQFRKFWHLNWSSLTLVELPKLNRLLLVLFNFQPLFEY